MGEGTLKLTFRPEVVALVPEYLAREADALPITRSRNEVTIAVAHTLSKEMRAKLRFILDCEICEEIHPIEAIRKAIDDHYGLANDTDEFRFYYPGTATILDDGTITMGASGYGSKQGMTQWSGWKSFPPDDPDYGLWRWVISQGARFSWVVSSSLEYPSEEWLDKANRPTDLGVVRKVYQREA